MKKISVIVPLYNAEKYAARCIESIINQTYKKLEIILVNDGSNDNTLSICKEFASTDNRIIVYDKENGGVSSARNAGEYIRFVDSDDYIDSRMYEMLVKSLEKENANIAECGINRVLDQNSIKSIELTDEILVDNYNACVSSILQENTFPSVWNKIFKKKLFKEIRFPNYKYGEDYYVLVLCSYYSHKKTTILYIGYNYFYNEDSAVNEPFLIAHLDDIKSSEELYSFFKYHSYYPKISEYIALHIVMKTIGLYRNALKSNYSKQAQTTEYLTMIFKKYIKYVSNDLLKLIPHKRLVYCVAIKLFEITPEIFHGIMRKTLFL